VILVFALEDIKKISAIIIYVFIQMKLMFLIVQVQGILFSIA